jgi:ACS family pantothenate transporter-like MFS transporter
VLLLKCLAGRLEYPIDVEIINDDRFMQAGIYNGMNGTGGLKGWRWLLIFDGIISLPIAFLGFWLIPDSPANTRAFYLTAEDRETGRNRMEKIGRAKATGLSWNKIKGFVSHWPVWVFVIPYV